MFACLCECFFVTYRFVRTCVYLLGSFFFGGGLFRSLLGVGVYRFVCVFVGVYFSLLAAVNDVDFFYVCIFSYLPLSFYLFLAVRLRCVSEGLSKLVSEALFLHSSPGKERR